MRDLRVQLIESIAEHLGDCRGDSIDDQLQGVLIEFRKLLHGRAFPALARAQLQR